MDPLSVTVVVPTFNRESCAARCVTNLPKQIPVILVDDGSTDGTRDTIKSLHRPNLTYIHQSNAGPASARNTGVANARSEFVAFTDDDCVPAEDWPLTLARRLSHESKRVAGVGGRVLPLRDGWIARYSTLHHILEPPPSCSYLVTANCCYRRSAILEANGFDERLRHPGGEDTSLARAVRRRGYLLGFEPAAIVFHDYRESLVDFARTFFRYGQGCANDLVR
jgi:glycosyltransferase involved in cell wall biosynthesis